MCNGTRRASGRQKIDVVDVGVLGGHVAGDLDIDAIQCQLAPGGDDEASTLARVVLDKELLENAFIDHRTLAHLECGVMQVLRGGGEHNGTLARPVANPEGREGLVLAKSERTFSAGSMRM
jgi:hypothetical protein